MADVEGEKGEKGKRGKGEKGKRGKRKTMNQPFPLSLFLFITLFSSFKLVAAISN